MSYYQITMILPTQFSTKIQFFFLTKENNQHFSPLSLVFYDKAKRYIVPTMCIVVAQQDYLARITIKAITITVKIKLLKGRQTLLNPTLDDWISPREIISSCLDEPADMDQIRQESFVTKSTSSIIDRVTKAALISSCRLQYCMYIVFNVKAKATCMRGECVTVVCILCNC